jgi:hypothetical protein
MVNTMRDQTVDIGLRAGWLTEKEMAKERRKSERALRAERQRRDGPPWTKDGQQILYSVEGYRAWLVANQRPAGRPEPLKPHHGNFGHGRGPVQRGRKRALESASA